ncbi:MAG: cysteine desulfurase [Gammaproteobacteria bacterium]|nr:cysteine desulfurase [Gammaproteobacteria bacterium]MCY4277652.1 cysteine desulfurase [Gammaproteobacteria bacterium]
MNTQAPRGKQTDEIRRDFPIFSAHPDLVYLDSAATTQKPRRVVDAIRDYYEQRNANVHRAAHTLATEATVAFESARERVRDFIGAASVGEVIWTRGTTEAINLVAASLREMELTRRDIVITELEHHSNIVPWQQLAAKIGGKLKVARITSGGEIDLEDLAAKLGDKTLIVAFNHVSNALGTLNPVAEICALARARGALVLVDGAQATGHIEIDVKELGCDFYAFSGHKMFGPTGIGVLYGREDVLDTLPVWQTGGEMIERVSFGGTTFNRLPYRFEAGTPNIAGAIGLAAAVEYIQSLDRAAASEHEHRLLALARSGLQQIDGVRVMAPDAPRSGVLSFVDEDVHHQDLGTLLNEQSIALRTGHHCAMPLMERLGVAGVTRVSIAPYNSEEDIARLLDALAKARALLA